MILVNNLSKGTLIPYNTLLIIDISIWYATSHELTVKDDNKSKIKLKNEDTIWIFDNNVIKLLQIVI